MREDVDDELADVVVDTTARFDGPDDRGEIVVDKDHHRGFACDIGARASHRHPDIGLPQGRRIVGAVAGHCDDMPRFLQSVGDA